MTRLARLRDAMRRIGGPDAVTWPAFVVTYLIGLVGHFIGGGAVNASTLERASFFSIAQLVMFVPLVLLRVTMLRDRDRPRPAVAMLGFVLASGLRGATLVALLVAADAVTEPLWAYRIISSEVQAGTELVVCALIVSSYRQRVAQLSELIRLNRELASTNERSREQVAERNEAVLDRVRATLAAEFAQVVQARGEATVQALQRLATDVVRPLSHELERSLPAWHPDAEQEPSVGTDWRQVSADLVSGKPIRPGTTTAYIAFAFGVLALALFPEQAPESIALAVIGLMTTLTAVNLVLVRVLDPQRMARSLALLLLGITAASIIAPWIVVLPIRDPAHTGPLVTLGPIIILLNTVLVSTWYALRAQQERAQEHLVSVALELRRELARLHQVDRLHHKALARALHGPVQAAATAAALRLEHAAREGTLTAADTEAAEEPLREALRILDVDSDVTVSLDDALHRIVSLWDGVCAVEVAVTSQARAALDDDIPARTCVVEILTDAVSNAARHGHARRVTITIEYDRDLQLTVTDDGETGGVSAGSGLGTKVLEECATEWRREALPAGQRLTATIPVEAGIP